MAINDEQVVALPRSLLVSGHFPPHYWLLTIQLQIGFPHVGADEYDFGNDVLAHSGEESLEGFDGSFFAYPEKAGHAQIDLVDQGEIFVTSGVLDFVDSDSVNLAEHTVLQAPGDHMLHRVEDLVPVNRPSEPIG
jgi:hypothetical protein